jgi:hypothetical protein
MADKRQQALAKARRAGSWAKFIRQITYKPTFHINAVREDDNGALIAFGGMVPDAYSADATPISIIQEYVLPAYADCEDPVQTFYDIVIAGWEQHEANEFFIVNGTRPMQEHQDGPPPWSTHWSLPEEGWQDNLPAPDSVVEDAVYNPGDLVREEADA